MEFKKKNIFSLNFAKYYFFSQIFTLQYLKRVLSQDNVKKRCWNNEVSTAGKAEGLFVEKKCKNAPRSALYTYQNAFFASCHTRVLLTDVCHICV